MSQPLQKLRVQCCIAGGGPAGMMLGFLLARAGINTLVLEKHADFLRDFRGDTIHPSTLEVMRELGLLEEFLKLPHQEMHQLRAQIGRSELVLADFSRLKTRCRFVALMPQWDFLNFLVQQARRFQEFRLLMQAEVTGLIEEGGRIAGLRVQSADGPLEIAAELVVGADGRHSVVRKTAGLEVDAFGVPMDVLWVSIPQEPGDPKLSLRFDRGRILLTLDRGAHWQCGLVIPKGGAEAMQLEGIDALHSGILEIAPFLGNRVRELRDWSSIKLLTVRIDRLRRWYRPGLLCLGDAAHAMSPIGGVGINLAIQDAVAAANILAGPLHKDALTTHHLAQIQKRRAFATRLTQGFQMIVQKQLVGRVLSSRQPADLPLPLRLLNRSRLIRWIRGRIIGIGFRPEHVKSPDLHT